MKQNQKKKKRLLLALSLMLLTGVVLSTSTYAWFTANKVVTVNDINVNVAASNGIQVSVDGLNWKTMVSNEDIIGAINTYSGATNQLPTGTATLSPVSTVGEIDTTTGFMKMFSGNIESNAAGNYIIAADKVVEQNGETGSFIAFDLFMQVTTDTNVYLTDASKVALTGTIEGIDNSSRVAIINEGNTATGSDAETIQGLANATDDDVFLWELNNDVHTKAAIANAANNYGITTQETNATKLDYYGVKAAIAKEKEVLLNSTSTEYFAKVTPSLSTTKAGISADKYEQALTLKAGITKVRIYMWIEGQDVDCENNASGGSLKFSLQFSTNSSVNAVE